MLTPRIVRREISMHLTRCSYSRPKSSNNRDYGTMTTLHAGTVLTPEERLARRNLILRDALSLLTLFLITAVIFALTLLLYRSFENHRVELGQRWKLRGEQALHAGRPKEAIDALRIRAGLRSRYPRPKSSWPRPSPTRATPPKPPPTSTPSGNPLPATA